MNECKPLVAGLRAATPKLNWDAILTDYPVLFGIEAGAYTRSLFS